MNEDITFPMYLHLGIEHYLGGNYKLIAYIKGDVTDEDISSIQDVIEDKLKRYDLVYDRYDACVPNYPYGNTSSLFHLQSLPDDDVFGILSVLTDALILAGFDARSSC